MNAGHDENALNDADANEDLFDTVKKQKRVVKTQLMKLYTRLIKLMTKETIDRDAILAALEETEEKKMETIQIGEDLVVLYEKKGDKRNVERSEDEIDKVIEDTDKQVANVKDFLSSFLQKTPSLPSSDSSMSEFKGGNVPKLIEAKKKLPPSTYELLNPRKSDEIPREYKDPLQSAKANENSQEGATIGRDMWSQLKRVSILVFNGDKKTYEGWKTAFMACIDQAPATPEYMLLQLRQHLSGEALKAVETLGHLGAAYEAAKERLERKIGCQRRKIALHVEELEAIKSVRPGNARDIERFADLLDVDMKNWAKGHYVSLCKKLNESALAHYHRWMSENGHWESVETLKEFIVQEAEFQTMASETIRGVNTASKSFEQKRNRKDSERSTFFGRDKKTESHRKTAYMSRPCKVCNGQHGVWRCKKFKAMSVQERWDAAKRLYLCFHCLGGDHLAKRVSEPGYVG